VHNARAAHHGHDTAGATTFTSGITVPTATANSGSSGSGHHTVVGALHDTHVTATSAYKLQQQHSARGRGGVFFGASTVVQQLPEVNGFSTTFQLLCPNASFVSVSDACRLYK
jgi:hypothetical protein